MIMHLRRALKRQNVKTACTELKAAMPMMAEHMMHLNGDMFLWPR
jgi:hypothetical protein